MKNVSMSSLAAHCQHISLSVFNFFKTRFGNIMCHKWSDTANMMDVA
jgi:hypothetical protein